MDGLDNSQIPKKQKQMHLNTDIFVTTYMLRLG